MNSQEFRNSIDELHERLKSLTATKGQEYKGGEETSQFANFERHAAAMGMTREQVLFVYLSKHLDSITTYVKDRAVGKERQYAEPITGRVDDAILYLLLFRGMAIENEPRRVAMSELRVEYHEADAPQLFDVPVFVETPRCGSERGPMIGARTLVLSSHQPDAVAFAALMGLPAATSALAATDQLHGVLPGAHVIFIHHGHRNDEAMFIEMVARCEKQGLTYEAHHL